MPNCRHIFDTPPKIFFYTNPKYPDPHSTKTQFYESTPPPLTFTKIINPAKWGYSPSQTTYRKSLFFESLQYISYLYITTKRGSGGKTNQKGDIHGQLWEGGFPHARPPPSSTGIACLRTHPGLWPSTPKRHPSDLLHRPSTLRKACDQATLSPCI
jgi:hypothetical protein